MAFNTYKTLGIAVGLMACAPSVLAQTTQDSDAIQRRLDALQQQVQQLQQELAEQKASQQAENTQTREMAEQNRSLLDNVGTPQFSGAVELAYTFNDWNETSKDTTGDMNFGKFIIGMDGGEGPLSYSFQYRFYDGYRFLHHAWAGYQFSDDDNVQLGLVQTPFGNMDYGYLGWYGTLPYLAGFNDNQNAGIKWDHSQGAWDTSLAFFKSDQLGDGNEHYGANAIGSSAQGNTEENQVAARAAYTFGQGSDYTTEVNLSAKGGQLYNNNTQKDGDSWAVALGMNGNYGNWTTQLQATTYEFNAKNPDETVSDISDNVVQIGAFGFNYLIPAEGQMYSASLAYSMNVDWGVVDNLYFYNDFSYIDPSDDYSAINGGFGDMDDPMLNDLGMKITAGRYYAWFDIVTNKNGLNYFGSPVDDGWHTSVQSHFGITY
ncbi:hypothetical protein [Salinicola rhizosphaerae]|uniref:Outer membrane beta barrel protein n=1 Tax=Salinicola rhizosphaerae TaxID=1443141 RepID=A0ABQ3DZW8_9GAMM|nr:hypothetical protein [Salinicola rhizosphaerae]GHB19296.1 outer membrane beta barrel protein [Salinicola rhizosphaerae]